MKTAVIIPALNPDQHLLDLVTGLRTLGCPMIIIVDDGSKPECRPLFNRLKQYDCIINRHTENLGKGAALKTGIREAASLWPGCAGYVTADADGQHSPEDILRIAAALEAHPGSLVLGTRDFSEMNVPFKSRWGNSITSQVFRLETGVRCSDTQTGLRGIPTGSIQEYLAVPGSRFEFEMNSLLKSVRQKRPLVEVPIDTIYHENNRSSHFHPLRDSILIYWSILRFGRFPLVSAVMDLSLFTLFNSLVSDTAAIAILVSTILARLISGCISYLLNNKWGIAKKDRTGKRTAQYLTLFCGQMLVSGLIIELLSALPVPLIVVKIIVDSGLFLFSCQIQKKLDFQGKKELTRKECVSKL